MSPAADPNPKPLHVVALGSSFAAGPGILPYEDRDAGRSAHNYAHLLSSQLSARLTDLSVSGATLLNILNEPQKAFRGSRIFQPQLTNFPSDADIVTITGGGNDLNYIGGIMYEAFGASWLGSAVRLLFPAPGEATLTAEEIAERFVSVIDVILASTPKAKIFLVEYLTLFGTGVKAGRDVHLSEKRIGWYREVSERLREGYRLAAIKRPGVEVVHAGELSEGHGLGAEEPWVEGLSLKGIWERKAPFHPNAKGMEAVAGMLLERIKI